MPDKKRLLLVYPNQRWLKTDVATTWNLDPRLLCALGAMVIDIVNVKILDAQKYDLSREQLKKEIEDYRPDYVGISVLTSEYGEILNIAADIVKSVDDIIVIAGGVHVTTQYETAMTPSIDYGCRGEGEYFLRELILYLEGKGDKPRTGLIFWGENAELLVQEKSVVDDLTRLPFPDYSLVNMFDYVNSLPRYGSNRPPQLPGIHITVSRGCPYGCSFCQVEMISGRKVRMRAPDDIVAELEFLKKTYGIKSFVFQDDNLFCLKRKAKALMRLMVERGLNLTYTVSGFALFVMDDEMLDLLKASGCQGVNIAIESGVERVLRDIVKKPIKDLKAVPSLIKRIKERNMFVIANFIIGLPGETWEEIRQTIRFAENCNADYVKIFVAVPLIGTRMYDMAVKMGALEAIHDEVVVDWRYSQIKSEEWTAKDISILRAYEWDRINFAPDRIGKVAEIWGISIEELRELRKKTRDSLRL